MIMIVPFDIDMVIY